MRMVPQKSAEKNFEPLHLRILGSYPCANPIFNPVFLLCSLLWFIPVCRGECGHHDFGAASIHYCIYADGRTWSFTPQNTMIVQGIVHESTLAAYALTFHLQLKINGTAIDSWDHNVDSITYQPYIKKIGDGAEGQRDRCLAHLRRIPIDCQNATEVSVNQNSGTWDVEMLLREGKAM